MNTTTKLLGGIGAAVIAAGMVYVAVTQPAATPTPAPADICSGAYWFQRACDTTWMVAWPGSGQPAGHFYFGCSAHTWIVHAEDGKDYPVKDQGSSLGTYKRAPDTAPAAQAAWDQCYLPPHAFQGGSSYHCAEAIRPNGVLNYSMKTLAQVPNPPRASFAALYGCGGPVTPAPTPPPVVTVPGPGPCPTCPPAPCTTVQPQPTKTKTPGVGPPPTRTYPVSRSRIRGPEFVDVS